MQRNWELIREILVALESRETTHGVLSPDQIPGFAAEVVSYHLCLLRDAGLVEARCLKPSNVPMHCMGVRLTWAGHEFLDSIRNDTAWKKIKALVTSKGLDLTFDAVKVAAATVIKGMLGG